MTGELWSTEEGPQGGDELNLIQAGKNYGWPRVSLGRNYDGTRVGEGFIAPGLEEPVVFWVPAIAISGLSFYDGDKFPAWKGNAFVGGDAQQHRSAHPARAVQREGRADRPRDLPRRAEAAHPRGEAGARWVHLRDDRRDLRRNSSCRAAGYPVILPKPPLWFGSGEHATIGAVLSRKFCKAPGDVMSSRRSRPKSRNTSR